MRVFFTLPVLILLVVTSQLAASKTKKFKIQKKPRVQIELIVDGLGVPWSLEFLDKDRIIFSEREGAIKTLDLRSRKISKVSGAPEVGVRGQGGMLDLALHPNFKSNRRIYISYSKPVSGGATTAIATAILSGKKLESIRDIFVANNPSRKGQHFGSRISFDGNGHVFFSVGDRGQRRLAQDLAADQGKIHRLKLDGSIPKDNPFVSDDKKRPSVWSYGHRNPQGLVFDSVTGVLWESEHGPRGGDEINVIRKGGNYGWPIITYGKEYWGPKIGDTHKKGMLQPIYYYVPSIAPCGLEIYRGDVYPGWKGSLLSGALALKHINRLELVASQKVGGEERLFKEQEERIRDIRMGPDGFLYFSTDSGKIFKILPRRSS